MRCDLMMRRDRRGGIALMFALLLVPLIGLIGLSIDLGSTAMAKSRMDLAADAAALAAAKTSANAFAASATNYIAQGQSVGLTWFNGQAGTTSGLTMGTPSLTVSQSGGVFTASLTYAGSMATSVAKLFGFSTFPVNGASSATITVGGYADIGILMDLSSSMGIAATQAGIDQLGPLTLASNPSMAQSQNCAFACHWDAKGNDFYGLAKSNNIPLRVDVLISAVQGVVSQLITQNGSSRYRVGLYSFNDAFHSIFAVSGNLSAGLTAAQSVVVPLQDPKNLLPDTNFPLAMQAMTTATGTSGNGAMASAPIKFVFLVTDGLSDYVVASGNQAGQRVIQPMTPDNCDAMKANGVTILVLYTPYVPLPTNPYYVQNVQPVTNALVPDLTACASAPEYFFAASDPAGIKAAMQQMLQVATSTQARFIK